MDKLYPPAMTIWAFSFKARSDMLHKLQSKKGRNSDRCYCCLCPYVLRSSWDLASPQRSRLLHKWDSEQNIADQLGKALVVSAGNEPHVKGQRAPLGENPLMLYRNVRWKSSMLPFWSTREAKYSPLCSTADIKVRWWKGGEECVCISSLTELNVLYKWVYL